MAENSPVLAEPAAIMDVAQAPSRSLIDVIGVTKQFGNGTIALADANLHVSEGEFISLLGPSGCGKSTLLRLIAGLSEPTSGTIDWPSSKYDAAGRPLRDIGVVFQEPTLMPWATVFDNVFLPLRLAGVARQEATPIVMENLATVGLENFVKAYPRELSGGMKMRASIARAMVIEPKLLLMDEPFAALDEITRGRLNDDLLRIFAMRKVTVIFVTHSVFESVYLSSRIIVMSARPGRIFADMPIDATYPRGDEFRATPDYNRLRLAASNALHQAMGSGNEGH